MHLNEETVSELRWIKLLLIIIALPIVVVILQTMKSIFIPLIFAAFISFLFAPMRNWLTKRKVPLGLSILLMVIIISLIASGIGGVVYAAVNSFVVQLPKYQAKFTVLMENGISWWEELARKLDLAFSGFPSVNAASLLSGSGFSLTKVVSGTMGTFVSIAGTSFITLIFLIFLITGTTKMEKRLKRVLTESDNLNTLQTVLSIETQIQRYFSNKFLISFMTASVAMIVLWIFGIDFIIIAGIIYIVMNFIPNFGSILSVSFPVLICLLQYGFGFRIVALFGLLVCNELFFANFIEPKIMSDKMNLTPIMILISLIFWGYVWGVIGMMIAVPLTSIINIILKKMDDKNIISAVISDN